MASAGQHERFGFTGGSTRLLSQRSITRGGSGSIANASFPAVRSLSDPQKKPLNEKLEALLFVAIRQIGALEICVNGSLRAPLIAM